MPIRVIRGPRPLLRASLIWFRATAGLGHLRHLWLELFSRSELSTRKGSNSGFLCKARTALTVQTDLGKVVPFPEVGP